MTAQIDRSRGVVLLNGVGALGVPADADFKNISTLQGPWSKNGYYIEFTCDKALLVGTGAAGQGIYLFGGVPDNANALARMVLLGELGILGISAGAANGQLKFVASAGPTVLLTAWGQEVQDISSYRFAAIGGLAAITFSDPTAALTATIFPIVEN